MTQSRGRVSFADSMAPTSLTIRSATQDDESDVIALWRRCGLVMSYSDPTADFRFARGRENSDVLVSVRTSGTIVASVMVGHDGHRGWLYYVAVDPGEQRRGLGRVIVGSAESWLADRDIAKAQLLIRETNPGVVDFYCRLGWQVAPRVVMQKWLKEHDA